MPSYKVVVNREKLPVIRGVVEEWFGDGRTTRMTVKETANQCGAKRRPLPPGRVRIRIGTNGYRGDIGSVLKKAKRLMG